MTKVMVEPLGWVYVVIVLDWYTKKIVGHYAGLQAKTSHWLVGLDHAVQCQFLQKSLDQGLHLMSDNSCQPTSVVFMRTCATLGITQAFTSYNNPKGNVDTERPMRTLKEELLWLRAWTSSLELERAWRRGSTGTMQGICIRRSGIGRRVRSNNNLATVLSSWLLDKWGALQDVGSW